MTDRHQQSRCSCIKVGEKQTSGEQVHPCSGFFLSLARSPARPVVVRSLAAVAMPSESAATRYLATTLFCAHVKRYARKTYDEEKKKEKKKKNVS